jgi:hypothetical protein
MPNTDTITEAANRAYRALCEKLARGGECGLGELLTTAAAVGKTCDDVSRDVDAIAEAAGDGPDGGAVATVGESR